MKKDNDDSFIPIPRLQRLLDLAETLKKGKWTIAQLAKKYEVSQPTMYRYIRVLEKTSLEVEEDFNHHHYYIPTAQNDAPDCDFSREDWKFVRKLVQTAQRTAHRDSLLTKLVSKADLKKTPNLLVQTHLGGFIDKLEKAISSQRRVVLKGYHSGNSNNISDRLVEPIHFGDNYQTIFVLDTKDKICKHFLLERMDDVEVKRTHFKFEKLHVDGPTDMFGYSGKTICTITLKMSLRARLALKKYPLAEPYITKEKDHYIFKGPVSSFDGIGAFVLENLNDIKVLESVEFREYLLKRIKGATV